VILKYTDFKAFVTSRQLSAQYIDADGNYYLKAFDGYFSVECNLVKDVDVADTADFEANLKPNGNKSPTLAIGSLPPFGAKTFLLNGATKKLFARNTGVQFAVAAGSNVLTYTATYAWAKIIGMELINGEALDTCQLKVLDSLAGTYSGVPSAVLNQFGYTLNMAKDFYSRTSPFDADLYVGMQLQFTYVSISAKTLGLNIIQNEVTS